jgi:putative NIF3 family GTP cyclohydrolase 1 type 2
MHTNFDRAKGGINDVLAKRLGLSNVQEADIGRIGELPVCSTETLANHVAKSLNTHVQYVGERDDIKRVMVIGGSGFHNEYLKIAKELGAEAVVSSEMRHDVIRSRGDISLIDATHYATENPGMEELCPRLADMLGLDVEFIHHNPFIKVI